MIIKGLTSAIVLTVRKFPSLGSLSLLASHLKRVDVVELLSSIHTSLDQAAVAFLALFSIAGVISFVTVAVTLYQTAQRILLLIRAIRRGSASLPPLLVEADVVPIEGYIGLHVFHLLLLQQLVFWLTIAVVLVLVISATRVGLVTKLYALMLASAVSYVIQFFVQRFLIKKFLTKKRFFVVRPELYAIWHFAGLILGVFTGIVKSVVRWIMAIGLVSGFFARLDMSVLPADFSRLDEAHRGFLGMVLVEAKNGNPIVLVFMSILSLSAELQRMATSDASQYVSFADQTRKYAAVDDLFRNRGPSLSATVRNLAQLLLRLQLGEQPKTVSLSTAPPTVVDLLPFTDRASYLRRCRVRQRFWLWWLLHANPSLREDRKFRLEYADSE
jgi:hypothetical protein